MPPHKDGPYPFAQHLFAPALETTACCPGARGSCSADLAPVVEHQPPSARGPPPLMIIASSRPAPWVKVSGFIQDQQARALRRAPLKSPHLAGESFPADAIRSSEVDPEFSRRPRAGFANSARQLDEVVVPASAAANGVVRNSAHQLPLVFEGGRLPRVCGLRLGKSRCNTGDVVDQRFVPGNALRCYSPDRLRWYGP